jgi:hypothetical protein
MGVIGVIHWVAGPEGRPSLIYPPTEITIYLEVLG